MFSSRTPRVLMIAGLLSIAASGCSETPAPTVSSHPPAADLVCSGEPPVPTLDQLIADTTGDVDRGYTQQLLFWGRDCKDTLIRNCQWHKDRGATEPKDCKLNREIN